MPLTSAQLTTPDIDIMDRDRERCGAEAAERNAGTTSSANESTASGSAAVGKDGNQEAVTGASGVETSIAESAERNAGTTSSTTEPTASASVFAVIDRKDFLRYYKSSSIYKEYLFRYFESGNNEKKKKNGP
jgi:hypothetical protein